MQEFNKQISIIGYSGHSYVVIDTLKALELDIKGYLDKQEVKENPFNLAYLGFEDQENIRAISVNSGFALGIGDNATRTRVAHKVAEMGGKFDEIIHPTAILSESSKIGEGTFVSSGAIINALSDIGKYCIVNTGAIVEHECKIGEGVHIAPGAVLLGNVEVGKRTLIGGGSVVKQGVKIGSDVIIGAGSVVVNDVVDGATFVGNPAREITRKK